MSLDPSPFASGRLCVVGNVNRDVKISPINPGQALFEDGETSTDSIRETVGGGGANSALAAAALGAQRVSFAGKTGADVLGERLARTFESHGVEAHFIRDARYATGTSVNLVWSTGRRHFVSSLQCSESLSVEEIDLGFLSGHHHLLRADPWFAAPMLTAGGNRALFEAAHDAGLIVSLDINWDPHWGRSPENVVEARKLALRETLPLVDLAHGNVRELCAFADARDLEEALARLRGWGVGAVVVHMGEQGAGYFDASGLIVEPCVRAERVINTTGTGDVLSVCMMLLHARTDLAVREKLRLSNAVVAEYIGGRLDLVPELAP